MYNSVTMCIITIHEAVIRPVLEYTYHWHWHSSLTAEQLNALKQFSGELVKSLLEAVHIATTVVLLSLTAVFYTHVTQAVVQKIF